MPEIADGPEMERRLLAWKRIDKLRSQGTGVAPFETIFKEIQGLARANDAEKVATRLTYLESKLTGQEEQVKQARESLRGRGVPAIKAASHTPGNTPAQPGTTQPGASPPQASNEGFIPHDAERVKSIFNSQGNDIISQVMRKNSAEGYRLRDLKVQIEKLFQARDDAKAFALLGDFNQTSTRVLGQSPFSPGGGMGAGGMGGPGGMGPGPDGMGPGGGGPHF